MAGNAALPARTDAEATGAAPPITGPTNRSTRTAGTGVEGTPADPLRFGPTGRTSHTAGADVE